MGDKKTKIKDDMQEKKSGKAPDKKLPEKKIIKQIEGVRGMVRLANMNLEGTRKVRNSIMGINGIGKSLANSLVIVSGNNPEAMIGTLTDEQIAKLEDAMINPAKYGVPNHMLNRRSDPGTGEDRHLISYDLTFNVRGDIDFLKKIRCYKGVRHELGQPVRGQRTRSTFRTGVQMGVSKVKAKPGAPPSQGGRAPAGGAPAAKPAAGAPAAKAGPAAPAAKPAAGAASAKKEEKKK